MPNLLVHAPQAKRRSCRARCFLLCVVRHGGGGLVGGVVRIGTYVISFTDLNVLDLQPGSPHFKPTGPTILEGLVCLLDAAGDVGGVPMVREDGTFRLVCAVWGIILSSIDDAVTKFSSAVKSQGASRVSGSCPNSCSGCWSIESDSNVDLPNVFIRGEVVCQSPPKFCWLRYPGSPDDTSGPRAQSNM